MGPEIIGALIPVLGISCGLLAIWTSHQRKMAKLKIEGNAGLAAELAAQHAAHTRELEERVRVLERIVTDKGYDLASQIEALRDETPARAQLGASRLEA